MDGESVPPGYQPDATAFATIPALTDWNRQHSTVPRRTRRMDDHEDAVREFLASADDCYSEYDNGYTDADATLRRLETHIDDLRDAVEE
jgi:hypothetical protein